MQTENAPSRERQPELFEIHLGFQEQGKRLSDCLSRLVTIGNKLEDESGNLSESKKDPETKPHIPGITSDLGNCVNGYREYISQIERQLSKIEKHI